MCSSCFHTLEDRPKSYDFYQSLGNKQKYKDPNSDTRYNKKKHYEAVSNFVSSTWYSNSNYLSIPMFYQNKCSLTAFIDSLLNWTLYWYY